MKTTMSQGEKWRQYGVMVHDTPETLAGMLRIENGNGDAIAFAIDHETAKTITNAVNCHDDLLEACKVAFANLKNLYSSDHLVIKSLRNALEKAGAL